MGLRKASIRAYPRDDCQRSPLNPPIAIDQTNKKGGWLSGGSSSLRLELRWMVAGERNDSPSSLLSASAARNDERPNRQLRSAPPPHIRTYTRRRFAHSLYPSLPRLPRSPLFVIALPFFTRYSLRLATSATAGRHSADPSRAQTHKPTDGDRQRRAHTFTTPRTLSAAAALVVCLTDSLPRSPSPLLRPSVGPRLNRRQSREGCLLLVASGGGGGLAAAVALHKAAVSV